MHMTDPRAASLPPPRGKGETVSLQRFEAITGLSRRTLLRRIEEGMPARRAKRGGHWRIQTAPALHWLVRRNVAAEVEAHDPELASPTVRASRQRARLLEARARLTRREVEQRLDELIDVELVETVLDGMLDATDAALGAAIERAPEVAKDLGAPLVSRYTGELRRLIDQCRQIVEAGRARVFNGGPAARREQP